MKDQISQQRVHQLHPKVKDIFQAFIEDAESLLNIKIRVVQGLRTFQEQQVLYDQGRTTHGSIVTNSNPGQSYHNYGLAIDMCPFKVDEVGLDWKYDFNKFLPLAEKHGLTWGGTFPHLKDNDHFENKLGHTWEDLLDKYNKGDFIPGTKFINL